MSDFPPNLEDGEQWLPSDIYEDIFSEYDYKQKAKVNIPQNLAPEIKSFGHGDNKAVEVQSGKTKGTGVFIPQMKFSPIPGGRIGTGVFLPSRVTNALIANPTNHSSGKNKGVIGKESFLPSKRYGFPNTGPTGSSK